jgi:hypothetical protein
MKKLTVVVMMAAMATFMVAAMASADDHEWRTIHGKYAFTGSNACLAAPFGFDSNLTAINGVSGTSAESWEGHYTFMPRGKGMLDVVVHDVGGIPGSGGSLSVQWEFHYTVKDGGRITFTEVPGSYIGKWLTGPMAGAGQYLGIEGSWDGVISPDGNHIHVTWGAPLILDILNAQGGSPIGVQLICNGSFVLFRLSDRDEPE